MASVRYTISVDPSEEKDVWCWLESQSNVSSAVRDAVKHYLSQPDLADIFRVVEENNRLLKTGAFASTPDVGGEGAMEPEEAKKNLDGKWG